MTASESTHVDRTCKARLSLVPAVWAVCAMIAFAIVQTFRIGMYDIRIPLIIAMLLVGACAYFTARAYQDWMARQLQS